MPKNLSFSDKTLLDWVRPPPWSKKSEYFLIRIFWIGRDPPPPLLTESQKKPVFFFDPSPNCPKPFSKGFHPLPPPPPLLAAKARLNSTYRCKYKSVLSNVMSTLYCDNSGVSGNGLNETRH